MSSVLESPPTTQKRLTPVEYVAALPLEDQEDILIHLVKLLRKENEGAAVIPLDTADEHLGYFLTRDGMQAYFDAYGPKLTAEDRAELQRDMKESTGSVTTEELKAWLREEVAAPAATPG